MNPLVKAFYDPATHTISYVVYSLQDPACAVIDPVLDYVPSAESPSVTTASAQLIVDFIKAQRLELHWILETHAHADHLSAAQWLKSQLGGKVAIGAGITTIQQHFVTILDDCEDVATDGRQFDQLLKEGDTLPCGALTVGVMHTPGHTPACVSYRIGDAVFVGDTLFMPDYGTARTDFPGGDAHKLFRSIQRLLSLPDSTRLFMCHDYPQGREALWETTVLQQRQNNVLIRAGVSEEEFVQQRQARDIRLAAPALLIPSLQANIRGGL